MSLHFVSLRTKSYSGPYSNETSWNYLTIRMSKDKVGKFWGVLTLAAFGNEAPTVKEETSRDCLTKADHVVEVPSKNSVEWPPNRR